VKKALIVGINAYPQSPLSGCVNDANDWNTFLAGKGYTNTVLLDSMATKANIVSGLGWLLNGAVSGDTLVFAYSGHGSKEVDVSGDEPDGFDEVLCPVDFFGGQYINDDQLRAIFAGLPAGITLEVFLDACYSGTATRTLTNDGLKARCIPGPITKGKKVKTMMKSTVVVPGLNHVFWAGCKSNQTSVESTINGVQRGLFSYYVIKTIKTYPNNTRNSIITAVQAAVQKFNNAQLPQLEVTQTESTQKPFM
jgi:hypothetical protein